MLRAEARLAQADSPWTTVSPYTSYVVTDEIERYERNIFISVIPRDVIERESRVLPLNDSQSAVWLLFWPVPFKCIYIALAPTILCQSDHTFESVERVRMYKSPSCHVSCIWLAEGLAFGAYCATTPTGSSTVMTLKEFDIDLLPYITYSYF